MPSFPLDATPINISQYLTRAGVIQNTGNAPVYLSAQSSVSEYAYDQVLLPGSSIDWPGGTLWAVAPVRTQLAVMYDASGASVGSVAVVGDVSVTGDVSVDGPVSVQGTVGIDGPVNVQGNVGIDGTVAVAGDVNIDGPVTVDKIETTVPVAGDVTVSGPVTVQGDVGIQGNVNVNPVTVDGPVTVEGDVGITGPVSVTGTVNADVTGAVEITNASINASVEGNVVVDSGTVTVGGILTPVEIQGGGEYMGYYSGTLGAFDELSIPLSTVAPSGKIYPSLLIKIIGYGTWPNPTQLIINVPYGPSGGLDLCSTSVGEGITGPNDANLNFGASHTHQFFVPVIASEYSLELYRESGSAGYEIWVFGSSTQVTAPVTTPPPLTTACLPGAGSGMDVDIVVPPSFQPYRLYANRYPNTGGTLSFTYQEFRPDRTSVMARLHHPSQAIFDTTDLTSNLGATEYIIGGSGHMGVIRALYTATTSPLFQLVPA